MKIILKIYFELEILVLPCIKLYIETSSSVTVYGMVSHKAGAGVAQAV
jgi:hypothetical protein